MVISLRIINRFQDAGFERQISNVSTENNVSLVTLFLI